MCDTKRPVPRWGRMTAYFIYHAYNNLSLANAPLSHAHIRTPQILLQNTKMLLSFKESLYNVLDRQPIAVIGKSMNGTPTRAARIAMHSSLSSSARAKRNGLTGSATVRLSATFVSHCWLTLLPARMEELVSVRLVFSRAKLVNSIENTLAAALCLFLRSSAGPNW